MKKISLVLIICILALGLNFCSSEKSESDYSIINKSEAAQEAAAEINEKNAEKIADSLLKEIESDNE